MLPSVVVLRADDATLSSSAGLRRACKRGPGALVAERPGVAKPERRQQVQRRGVGAAVGRADADQNVLGRVLGVLDEHVEVAVLVEDAGVEQFVFQRVLSPAAVFLDQIARRETPPADIYRDP